MQSKSFAILVLQVKCLSGKQSSMQPYIAYLSLFYVFQGQWGHTTPSGLENNLSTSALELSVSPQLESSLEYDSYFIVYFYQDQMDIRPNLKMHFPIPP